MQAVNLKRKGARRSASLYADDLWFFIHNALDGDEVVLGMRTFLDDSGTHDASPIVTIGGPVMPRTRFRVFSKDWPILLKKYRVAEPLHMNDFVSNGKYVTMYPELKISLFREVAKLINRLKLYSISVSIPQDDFRSELSEEVRKTLIGPYAFAFFIVVIMNRYLWQSKNIEQKTGYLVDDGVVQTKMASPN